MATRNLEAATSKVEPGQHAFGAVHFATLHPCCGEINRCITCLPDRAQSPPGSCSHAVRGCLLASQTGRWSIASQRKAYVRPSAAASCASVMAKVVALATDKERLEASAREWRERAERATP